ncbi:MULTISPECIES: ferritin-like domain-containing protein [unclassified Janthinobacterium]|uniref:ferritin-like domain-containing protein n=1 Tax=unclassified Janthinobacterium TaxID=2610881 RepID=UPI000889EBCE|nr:MULTISPECIES: ferritin-like domain-containing protein [unclassified Janthinobacterium]SDA58259.1 Ferritin-like [Janthinobacterium sp. 551a]SFB29757.1 Ferritin-like [Janthinobacterium sp. 344]
MKMPVLGSTQPPITRQPLDQLATDTAAVRAIAQAAVSVELFTIPLYMATMYSIQGTHQINAKDISYYKGRQWPGMSTSAHPASPEEEAFNIIFSVFIQEMLHLQMAANLATAIGAAPCFTGSELQSLEHGWTCYGKACTVIPHIVDLQDTSGYRHVRVNLEELNSNQCDLFLAIEQPEEQARAQLAEFDMHNHTKYFPEVPFDGWTPGKHVHDLPLFGTIGYMYECYARYISIEYEDGETLWQKLFVNGSVQQDMFNSQVDGHTKAEFPRFDTSFGPQDQDGGQIRSFNKAIDMMAAITDQGEGSDTAITRYRRRLQAQLMAVKPDYREDLAALKVDYPSYTEGGEDADSRDATARHDSAAYDHYERFGQVKAKLPVKTWAQWHQDGHSWDEKMLTNASYDKATAPKNIPGPDVVAGALNRLKDKGDTLKMLSTVATGAIYGITSVLDTYWQKQDTTFPYPSMVGAGDRMAICWAVLGQAPNLATGVPKAEKDVLYHACQGMHLAGEASATCAALAVYHTCRGSNGCHAQGGCGFAQLDAGGPSGCGHAVKVAQVAGNLCGAPKPAPGANIYSAPSDNKCGGFGGCAVPISASQLFPKTLDGKPATMTLYDFGPAPGHHNLPLGQTITFDLGESVYEKAWEAYGKVMAARGTPVGAAPAPTDLRLALPPST